jgi:hypothetical protein
MIAGGGADASDDEDAASMGGPAQDTLSADPADAATTTTPAVTPTTSRGTRSVPASGTGGLY